MLLFIFALAICGISVKGECEEVYLAHGLWNCNSQIRDSGTTGDLNKEQCSTFSQELTCKLVVLEECVDSPKTTYYGIPLNDLRASLERQLINLNAKCARFMN
ncbi:uncharacterized protein LOC121390453 [Gigantopelta aegis]|uniref:uncharacterized protein LOC121390453 n=1 Tax=Gigantopelta aegis TaxID=1735272 RepID=UPI001B88C44E|nr:uncharacterized protein LOC121390453 [Gigantopelta aegis]